MYFIGKIAKYLFSALFAIFTLGVLAVAGVYLYYSPKLPTDTELRTIKVQVPLRIYSSENQLLAEYGEKRSQPVKVADVPDRLKFAFLDIEDARFYEHAGIDPIGVARAVSSIISTGSSSQGASTITMQLARNSFLGFEKTLDRKLKETLLAIKMEQNLNKNEILELYLNKIYLGNRAYGVGAAAETYYGKRLNELTFAQAAMIAGLPKAPSRYNPIVNPERAMIRRNYILQRMLELGHISQADYQTAINEPNTATVHKTEFEMEAPYLAEMVRADIVKRFGEENAYTQGYHVYTTLDSKQQAFAAKSLRRALMDYDQRHGYRGAEDTIDLGDYKTEEDRVEKLATYPTIDGIPAALVLSANATAAELLLPDETRVTLDLESMKWARPFVSADRRGSFPRRVNEVLKAGNIVRINQPNPDTKAWKLTEIPGISGALVSMDPSNGAIRAVMGGFDFAHSSFNRATQAARQPGSSFKPFVYAAALSTKHFTPSSIVNDAPLDIPGSKWKPQNFGGHYIGPTTLAEAIAHSRNLVAIRLLRMVGINYTIDFATKFGFSKENLPANLTLALGTGMTNPVEMATAYSAFANGGYKVSPFFITRIEDANGKLLFEDNSPKVCGDGVETCKPPAASDGKQTADATKKAEAAKDKKTAAAPVATDKPIWESPELTGDAKAPSATVAGEHLAAKRIMDKNTHYQIVSMLQGVVQFGTAARAGRALNRKDIGGKTGTTNDQKDAWFCGFSPSTVAITWVGFDDMAKLGEGETAASVAVPIWVDYMHRVLEGTPSQEWDRPTGLKMDEDGDTPDPSLEGKPAPAANTGFQYKSENDLVPPRAAPPAAPAAPGRPAPAQAPAQHRRPPERVEIPEQIF